MTPTPHPVTYWSIGLIPVQGWIAESRRSRDLGTGSCVLSWMMARLLVSLRERDAHVLLPHLASARLPDGADSFRSILQGTHPGVSNRASGRLARSQSECAELMRELEADVERLWQEVVEETRTHSRRSAADLWRYIDRAVGSPGSPIQTLWATWAEPAAVEASQHQRDRAGLREVDRHFAGTKRARPVVVHAGEPVRKCGQCGKREAMGGPDPAEWKRFQDGLAALPGVEVGLRFDLHEMLCPVCAVKRLAGYLEDRVFPSTSRVAASDWLWSLENTAALRDALAALQRLYKAGESLPGYDRPWSDPSPLYYPGTLRRLQREAQTASDAGLLEAIGRVDTRRQELEGAIRDAVVATDGKVELALVPPSYLAVLMFDGDSLGRRLRDELHWLPEPVAGFPHRLRRALEAGDRQLGSPFYLGGDEGLILAPISSALELAHRIREEWREAMAGGQGEPPTLSLGMALFHRERPLGAAIEAARRSLELAKDLPGKDAMTVTVHTASGSSWTASAHWGVSWKRVAAAVALIRAGSLSAGWPHDVEAFLRQVPVEAFAAGERSRTAIREEVRRLTGRRSAAAAAGGRSTPTEVWEALAGESWWREQPSALELSAQADQLHLIAFLARESGSAPGPSEGEAEPEPAPAVA